MLLKSFLLVFAFIFTLLISSVQSLDHSSQQSNDQLDTFYNDEFFIASAATQTVRHPIVTVNDDGVVYVVQQLDFGGPYGQGGNGSPFGYGNSPFGWGWTGGDPLGGYGNSPLGF